MREARRRASSAGARLAAPERSPAHRPAPSAPRHTTAAGLLRLQRTAGNAAVTALLAGRVSVQRKPGEATTAALDHIFKGELKKVGNDFEVTGYHSEAAANAALVEAPATAARRGMKYGMYHKSPINPRNTPSVTTITGGKAVTAKAAGSTFFPDSWTREWVTYAIEQSTVVTGGGDANRKVEGPLPGVDKGHYLYMMERGGNFTPIRIQ